MMEADLIAYFCSIGAPGDVERIEKGIYRNASQDWKEG